MTAPDSTLQLLPAAPVAEIDRSCRFPVLLLFWGAAKWLVLAAGLGLLASVKLHAPNLLADAAWLTYGRVQLVASHAFLYGFALPAGLAVALWLVARLGRNPLELPAVVSAGAVLWNLAVLVGSIAILIGDGTGFDWLEYPGYAAVPLFIGYVLIGWGALDTFRRRREPTLYPSQWFLLAALFWFPWVYSTANLLLQYAPVRGILQAAVAWWYVGNLTFVWFGFVGLAALFYLVPSLTGRPLYSRYHAMIAFWLLVLFNGWRGIPPHAPLPSWMAGVGTVCSVLSLVPLLAVGLILHRTLAGSYGSLRRVWPLPLAVASGFAWLLGNLLSIGAALPDGNRLTAFTLFTPGASQLLVYGFFALAVFAAAYLLLPRLLPEDSLSPRLIRVHAWTTVLGIAVLVLPLLVGGVVQGLRYRDPQIEFLAALKPALMALRLSTLGDLLLFVASVVFLANLGWALVRWARACWQPVVAAAVRPEGAEVQP